MLLFRKSVKGGRPGIGHPDLIPSTFFLVAESASKDLQGLLTFLAPTLKLMRTSGSVEYWERDTDTRSWQHDVFRVLVCTCKEQRIPEIFLDADVAVPFSQKLNSSFDCSSHAFLENSLFGFLELFRYLMNHCVGRVSGSRADVESRPASLDIQTVAWSFERVMQQTAKMVNVLRWHATAKSIRQGLRCCRKWGKVCQQNSDA